MDILKVMTCFLLVANVVTIKNTRKPFKEQLGYNPAELLANIFNPNITTESRESRYNTIQLDSDYIEGNETDKLNTDKPKFNSQFTYKDENLMAISADGESTGKINIQNDLNEDIEGLKLNIKDFWKNYKDVNFDYDGEPRSDFKRRKNKKRKPRVQFEFNHNYSGVGANPSASNHYGNIPAQYLYPITPTQLEVAPNVPYIHPGFAAQGLSGQSPGYLGPVSPFIPRQIASGAFAAIIDALTSIAQNDDYQCVPRLLCETAGGAVGSTKILDSVANLQPLFGMLANYQGLSTTPLFLFGRAVFLGMTSKGNTASCRYAYPQCPNDPDELVHYLNNHKGGFFRFFSNVRGKPTSGQNFHPYGLHKSPKTNENDISNLYNDDREYNGIYNKRKQNDINSNALARIQNEPAKYIDNVIDKTKWLFPDDIRNKNVRFGKELKFPSNDNDADDTDYDFKDYNRKGKAIVFPEKNNDDRYANNYKIYNESYNKVIIKYGDETKNDYVFDYVNNFYVKREKKTIKSPNDDNIRTVYIVRGNGDPRHPEIVKLRPGQSIQ